MENQIELDQDNEAEDDDFSELNEMLETAMSATQEERALKAARKRLAKVVSSNHPDAGLEQMELVATIRRLEEGRVWVTVGSVALFKSQTCAVCFHSHRFFQGWFTEQTHTSDPNARRLVAGKPVEFLPERQEIHNEGDVEMCIDCVETQLAVNIAVGRTSEDIR